MAKYTAACAYLLMEGRRWIVLATKGGLGTASGRKKLRIVKSVRVKLMKTLYGLVVGYPSFEPLFHAAHPLLLLTYSILRSLSRDKSRG